MANVAKPRAGRSAPNGDTKVVAPQSNKLDNLKALQSAINDASSRTAALWISFLTFMAYLTMTVGAVTHRESTQADADQAPGVQRRPASGRILLDCSAILLACSLLPFLAVGDPGPKARELRCQSGRSCGEQRGARGIPKAPGRLSGRSVSLWRGGTATWTNGETASRGGVYHPGHPAHCAAVAVPADVPAVP